MGVTKTDIFTTKQNTLAMYAKVLAHPARIAILEFVFNAKQCICGDLVKEIGLAQPTISQHLKELKSLGLLKGTVEGTSVCYCLHSENWTKLKSELTSFLNKDQSALSNNC